MTIYTFIYCKSIIRDFRLEHSNNQTTGLANQTNRISVFKDANVNEIGEIYANIESELNPLIHLWQVIIFLALCDGEIGEMKPILNFLYNFHKYTFVHFYSSSESVVDSGEPVDFENLCKAIEQISVLRRKCAEKDFKISRLESRISELEREKRDRDDLCTLSVCHIHTWRNLDPFLTSINCLQYFFIYIMNY